MAALLVSSGMAYEGTHARSGTWLGLVCALGMTLVCSGACSGGSADVMNSTSGGPVDVPPWACVPGETQPCPCPDELDGLLTCNADGTAFGECDCSPGAVSQGPPPTSTGTDGTASGTEGSGSASDSTMGGGTMGDSTTVGSTSGPDPTTSGGSTGPGGSSSGGASSSSG